MAKKLLAWGTATLISCAAATGCQSGGSGLASNGQPTPPGFNQPPEPGMFTKMVNVVKKPFQSLSAPSPAAPTVVPPGAVVKDAEPSKVGAGLYLSAARVYESTGNFPAATDQYRKALESEPNNLDALLGFARLEDRQNNLAHATKLYQQAVQLHPKSAAAHNDLGLCLARQEKFAEALAALDTAILLQPDKKLYRNNIATVLVRLNRRDEALRHLVAAHGEATANYNLAYLLHQNNDLQNAQTHVTRALELSPGMTAAVDLQNALGLRKVQYQAQPAADAAPTITEVTPPANRAAPRTAAAPVAPKSEAAPVAPVVNDRDDATPPLPDNVESYPTPHADLSEMPSAASPRQLPPVDPSYIPPSRY